MPQTNPKKSRSSGPKFIRRYIWRRDAIDAADRLRSTPTGEQYVVRFTVGQRVEHLILLVSFTMLGLTGLAQTFYITPIGNFILNLFGGIESIRQVHHAAAFVFGIQAIYHVSIFIYELFVYRRISRMFPEWYDLVTFVQMMLLNTGRSKKHPKFDRYTFEEKAEYWALVWGTVAMGITGIMQWFPVLTTEYLPGWAIPVGRALHRWEAILAVLAIATWHSYHAVLKKVNKSIFTGIMSIEDMEEEHPLELAYLEMASTYVDNKTWPVLLHIPLESEEDEEEAGVVEEKQKPREAVVPAPVAEKIVEMPAEVPADPASEEEVAQ